MRSAAIVALATCAAACTHHAEPRAELAVPIVPTVEVQETSAKPIARRGVVEYAVELHLGFNVPGVVARVHVKVGDRVARGQLLATLRNQDAVARFRAAGARAANAKRDFETNARLSGAGSIGPRQTETSEAELRFAEARVDETAELVDQTRLRSPVSGIVRERLVEAGEAVHAAAPVLLVEDPARSIVRVGVTSIELASMEVGDPVDVTVEPLHATVAATVTHVAPTPTPESGLFRVEIDMARPDAIPPGATVLVTFSKATGAPELRVPNDALVYRQDHPHVFRVTGAGAGAHVTLAPVEVGRMQGSEVVLAGGVRVGDRVVSEGGTFLLDGQAVTLL